MAPRPATIQNIRKMSSSPVRDCDELEAVERHQQAGQAADDGAAEHPARGPGDDQHRERAEERGREAPAERGIAVGVSGAVDVAEHPLADGHQPLAERGVDGEARTDAVIAALDPELRAVEWASTV